MLCCVTAVRSRYCTGQVSGNNRDVGAAHVGGASGHTGAGQIVRAESLTAKQQVALWLTRTSTQEIYNELKMSNIKNWVYPSSSTYTQGEAKQRPKQPLCGQYQTSNIHRNFSTKSLLEGSFSQEDQSLRNNPMRKCETVLALSDEPHRKKNNFQKSKSKVSLCASRISFFKRSGSKCHSEVMQQSNFPGIRPTNRLR